VFGRSKKTESSFSAEIVRHEEKTVSPTVVRLNRQGEMSPTRGRYEMRCAEHGESKSGLSSRKSAEAWAEIHEIEKH
jgi:hypothetical protein